MATTRAPLLLILSISVSFCRGVGFIGKHRDDPTAHLAAEDHGDHTPAFLAEDPSTIGTVGRGAAEGAPVRRPSAGSLLTHGGAGARGSSVLGVIVFVVVPMALLGAATLLLAACSTAGARAASGSDDGDSPKVPWQSLSTPDRSSALTSTSPAKSLVGSLNEPSPPGSSGKLPPAVSGASDSADESDVLFPQMLVEDPEGCKLLVDGQVSNFRQDCTLEVRLGDPSGAVILNLCVAESEKDSGIFCETIVKQPLCFIETGGAVSTPGAPRPPPEERKVVIRSTLVGDVPWAVVRPAGSAGGRGGHFVVRRAGRRGQEGHEIMSVFANPACSVVNATSSQNVLLGSMHTARLEGGARRELSVGCGADALLVLTAMLAALKLS